MEMNVVMGEGDRRLPIYLLLDCSGSMQGAPIEAVHRGVEQFAQEVRGDEFSKQTVHVGIITFGNSVDYITKGLVPIDKFQSPTLVADGPTPLGEALRVFQQALDTDVKLGVKGGQKGDWKPLAFILTDGEPTDDWETPRKELLGRQQRKVLNVITVGCGPAINDQKLKDIAIGTAIRIDQNPDGFKAFFKWMTQSAVRVSQPRGDEQPVGLPPTSPQVQVIQYVP